MPVESNPPAAVGEEERAAVERALARVDGTGGGAARSDLLPLLHGVHDELGWLPKGALQHLADRMNLPFPDVWGVATFYAGFRLAPPRGVAVHVCDDVACRLRGADTLVAAMAERYGAARRFTGDAHGAAQEAPAPTAGVDWETVPCLGQCEHAPVAVVAGCLHRRASLDAVEAAAAREGRADG